MQPNNFSVSLPWRETLRRSFNFFIAHFNQLRRISAAWFVIILLFNMLTDFPILCSMTVENCSVGFGKKSLSSLIMAICSVSVIVSYIRLVILHSQSENFWSINFGKRELRYIGKLILYAGLIILPAFLYGVIVGFVGSTLHINSFVFFQYFYVGLLAIAIFCTRFYLVLPAAAVDNFEMSFKKSFFITKGNCNKIFWAQILLTLPFLFLLFCVSLVSAIIGSDNYVMKMFFLALMIAISLGDACMKASFLAHIYQYFMYFYQNRQADEI